MSHDNASTSATMGSLRHRARRVIGLTVAIAIVASTIGTAPPALAATASLSVTVVGTDGGTPVPAAVVTVRSGSTVVATDTTDGSGVATFEVPPAAYTVRAEPAAGNPDLVLWRESPLTVAEVGATAVTLALRRPLLRGVVRKPDGSPAANAYVNAFHLGLSVGPAWGQTDADGRYMVDLPPGRVRVFLHPSEATIEYQSATHDITVEEPEDRDFAFPATTVRGRVTGPGGEDVPGSQVDLIDHDGDRLSGTVREDASFGFVAPPGTYRLVAYPRRFEEHGWRRSELVVEVPDPAEVMQVEVALGEAVPTPYQLSRIDPVDPDGGEVRETYRPRMSADGTAVAVVGGVRGEGESWWSYREQIHLHRVADGTTTPLLTTGRELPSSPPRAPVAIDAVGSVVAFYSSADNLGIPPPPGDDGLFVQAVDGSSITLIPPFEPKAWGSPWHTAQQGLALSGDGRVLAYLTQWRDDESGEDTNALEIARLHESGELVEQQVVATGARMISPAISRDGSTVAWIAFDEVAGWQLHVADLATGVQDAPRPLDPLGTYWDDRDLVVPSLSADGSEVLYVARVRPPDDVWRPVDHLRHLDRAIGVDRELRLFGPTPYADRGVSAAVLSGDGSTALAVARDPADPDGPSQAWAVDVASGTVTLVSQDRSGEPADANVYEVSIGPDGRLLAFTGQAQNLVVGDDAHHGSKAYLAGPAVDDAVPPAWPDGAALEVSDLGATQARIRWPEATDDVGVVGYRVTRDGTEVATTSSTVRELLLTGLVGDTSYVIAVTAVDAAGNASEPLATEVRARAAGGEPGEGSLVVTSVGPGQIALTWDDAGPGVTYRVLRTTGEGDPEPLADVTGTTFTDRGAPASSTLTYRVVTVDGVLETPHTVAAMIETPALTLPVTSVTAPRLHRQPFLELGKDLTVSVFGEPHRTATADVVLETPDGEPATVRLDLTETTPGVYRTSFPLVDVARIDVVRGRIADGIGNEAVREATGVPLIVSGAVTVSFESEGSLADATLTVSSDAARTSQTIRLTGDEDLTIPVVPAPDHHLAVLHPGGRPGGEVTEVAVGAGQKVPTPLLVRFPATLTAEVVDTDGDPVVGAVVTVQGPADRAPTRHTTGSTGQVVRSSDLHTGDEVELVVTPPPHRAWIAPEPRRATLAFAGNLETFVLETEPAATLSGTVMSFDGPAAGGTVTAVQTIAGRTFTQRTSVRSGGSYDLDLVAGDVRISVADWRGKAAATATLEPGTNTLDLVLDATQNYELELDLQTRQPDSGWSGPLDIDWRVAVHFGLFVRTDSGKTIGSQGWTAGRATLRSAPGDELTVCASGREAALPDACTSVVLGLEQHVPLELRLEARARVLGELIGADGSPYGGTWRATYSGAGRGDQRGSGSELRLGFPVAGSYDVVVSAGTAGSARFRVTVEDGDLQELTDTIRLTVPGPFSGDGNAIVAVRPEVGPDGLAEFRTTYRSGGFATGAVLELGIPPGATLAPRGLLVGDQEVAGTVQDGRVEVALGDLSPDASGVVRHVVQLPDDLPAGSSLLVTAGIRHGGRATADSLGAARIQSAGVSLAAPASTPTPRVHVSGRAPAGAPVEVASGADVLAAATASPGGRWAATVTLPRRGLWHEYELRARVVEEDETLISEAAWVAYDPTRPSIRSMAMRQDNGRVIRFDPADGVARFPYVLVPGSPIVVDLEFDRPDAVTTATVTVGSVTGDAVRQGTSPVFRARLAVPLGREGPIHVDVDAERSPIALDDPIIVPPADLDEARALLPEPLQDVGPAETEEGPAEEPGERSTTVRAPVPAIGSGGRMEATLTVTPGVVYEPTAKDLSLAREVGVPIYGVRNTATISRSRLSGQLTAWIPASELPTDPAAQEAFLRRSFEAALRIDAGSVTTVSAPAATAVSAAAAEGVRIGFVYAFNVATNTDATWSALTGGGKYAEIARLQGEIQDLIGCEGAPADALTSRLDTAMNKALANDALAAAYTILGAVAGAGTFGLGTIAVWGIGWGFGKILEADLNRDLDALRRDVRAAARECDRDRDRDRDRRRRDPYADPIYIYDPSGFVFEAVPSNRLEGVTTTVLYAPTPDGPWEEWDAEWYGQQNPLVTDPEGRYGWDVPLGFWQVRYEADGYLTGWSDVLEVLPPHFDVNVGLVSLAAPAVTTVTAVAGGPVELVFDRYLRAAWVDATTFLVERDGEAVTGTVEPVDAEPGVDDEPFARRFRFVPDTPLTAGEELEVTAVAGLQTYARVPLAEDVIRTITVADAPEPAWGTITDADTGGPIAGAEVTLFHVPGWVPQGSAEDAGLPDTCQTNPTKPGAGGWDQPAPTGVGVVEPADAGRIVPPSNPRTTAADGVYGWGVADGCWYVTVEAEGYEPLVSPVVGVNAAVGEVTDLHLPLVTLDTTPPVWPAGAELRGTTTVTGLQVEWPAATDDRSGEVTYLVSIGGGPAEQQTATSATFTDLQPDTDHTVTVIPKDAAGNLGAALEQVFRTEEAPDTTPPAWPSGAVIAVVASVDGLVASWPAATDDRLGAVVYRVSLDGEAPVEQSGTSRTFSGLAADTEYTVTVIPKDAAGNLGAPLTKVVRTVPAGPGTPDHRTSLLTTYGTTDGWTAHLAGDVTGNGFADLVSYHPARGRWWVTESLGDGRFAAPRLLTTYATTGGWDSHLVADVTGNGFADLVSYHPKRGRWWVTESLGEGAFAAPRLLTTYDTTDGWDSHLVADVTGNGFADLISYHPSRGRWWVTESLGEGAFADPKLLTTYGTRDGWEAHLVADVTGNGFADLISYHPSRGRWWVTASLGEGEFADPKLLTTYATTTGWAAHLVADVTGNGAADLISYHPSRGRWWVTTDVNR
jgi:hypothetical protein